MAPPKGMRTATEVVPKLGVKPGMPALRVGGVATYDRPIEHLAGQLDVVEPRVPLTAKPGRYGLVLCFALGAVDLGGSVASSSASRIPTAPFGSSSGRRPGCRPMPRAGTGS